MSEELSAEVVIIGSGAGGGTLAFGLARRGIDVLLVERGTFVASEPQNWDPRAVFVDDRYGAGERWLDGRGRVYAPRVHYIVGGSSKFWGACLTRFRREDFGALEHYGGLSPAWPISYDELAPFYAEAEGLYGVRGAPGQEPTEPSGPHGYVAGAVDHEPQTTQVVARLRAAGLHPYHLPLGIDLGGGGACVRCNTCDAYPCMLLAKCDADTRCVRPALELGARLATGIAVTRLLTDSSGRKVVAAGGVRDGAQVEVRGETFVVACGAVNSAVLLLRSGSDKHPDGLANSSGQVGRNYMAHHLSALMAFRCERNRIDFQKTIGLNDWYLPSPGERAPLGNLQTIGKVRPEMLPSQLRRLPRAVLEQATSRSLDWLVTTEDLPEPTNRVTVTGSGKVRVNWQPTNERAHVKLIRKARAALRRAGFPIVLTRRFGIENDSHQCGTVRFGSDPSAAPLDPYCKAHDLDNLYVVDASFLPSSTALNPGLTIAAQALRVAAQSGIC